MVKYFKIFNEYRGFQDLGEYQSHLEGLFKQISEPYSQSSDSVGWGQGLRICMCNKFPGDADAVGPETTL